MKKMRAVRSPKVADAPPQTWSNCKVCGDQVYIAGMTAAGTSDPHPGDSMYTQAKMTFEKIRHLMEAAGGKMDDIIAITVFVTNLDENTEVWRARREFFSGDFPVSTLVQVSRVGAPGMKPPLKVEINAIGILGAG